MDSGRFEIRVPTRNFTKKHFTSLDYNLLISCHSSTFEFNYKNSSYKHKKRVLNQPVSSRTGSQGTLTSESFPFGNEQSLRMVKSTGVIDCLWECDILVMNL